MKCFGTFNHRCQNEGTRYDYESAAVFVNPDDPDGPTVRPILCDSCYSRMMRTREENERSFRQAFHR